MGDHGLDPVLAQDADPLLGLDGKLCEVRGDGLNLVGELLPGQRASVIHQCEVGGVLRGSPADRSQLHGASSQG